MPEGDVTSPLPARMCQERGGRGRGQERGCGCKEGLVGWPAIILYARKEEEEKEEEHPLGDSSHVRKKSTD